MRLLWLKTCILIFFSEILWGSVCWSEYLENVCAVSETLIRFLISWQWFELTKIRITLVVNDLFLVVFCWQGYFAFKYNLFGGDVIMHDKQKYKTWMEYIYTGLIGYWFYKDFLIQSNSFCTYIISSNQTNRENSDNTIIKNGHCSHRRTLRFLCKCHYEFIFAT